MLLVYVLCVWSLHFAVLFVYPLPLSLTFCLAHPSSLIRPPPPPPPPPALCSAFFFTGVALVALTPTQEGVMNKDDKGTYNRTIPRGYPTPK